MPVSGRAGLQTLLLCLLLQPHTSSIVVTVPAADSGKTPMALGAGTPANIGFGALVGTVPPVLIAILISSLKSFFTKICIL